MDRKHIVWVLEASSMAGGVKIVYELANRLSRSGYKLSIASLGEKPKWYALAPGVRWMRYPDYASLKQGVAGEKPEVVIATWWKTAYIVDEIAKACGCRSLYLVQDIETSYYLDPTMRGAVIESYNLGLEAFTTSRWVLGQMPTAHYMGIAIGRWGNDAGARGVHDRNVLACLRMQYLKGFRELAEFSRILQDKAIPLITFGVSAKAEYTMSSNHRHVPDLSDKQLQRVYATSGVFVSTSLHEGFSMTPLEAMACGCPVVMFNADGNMEYAEHDKNCLIATDVHDMATQVQRVLSDRGLANVLGKAGQVTAREYFSWEKPVGRLRELLDA